MPDGKIDSSSVDQLRTAATGSVASRRSWTNEILTAPRTTKVVVKFSEAIREERKVGSPSHIVTYSSRCPTTNLVNNLTGAFGIAQSIPQAMPESMKHNYPVIGPGAIVQRVAGIVCASLFRTVTRKKVLVWAAFVRSLQPKRHQQAAHPFHYFLSLRTSTDAHRVIPWISLYRGRRLFR